MLPIRSALKAGRVSGPVQCLLAGWLLLLPGLALATTLADQRSAFLAADSAIRAGAITQSTQLLPELDGYALQVYVEAKLYAARPPDDATLSAWLNEHQGSPPAEAIRSEWLRKLALKGDWASLVKHYQPQDDKALQCAFLNGRLKLGPDPMLAAEAATLWLAPRSLPPDCDPVFAYLKTQPEYTPALHWQRLVAAIERGNQDFARQLINSEPTFNRPWATALLKLGSAPESALEIIANKTADDPRSLDVQRLAYRRWAKQQAERAARHYADHTPANALQTPIVIELALGLAQAESPSAGAWLSRIPGTAHTAEVQNAMLRHALKYQDWARLAEWTTAPPAIKGEPIRWRYYHARALEALGDEDRAQRLYHDLATGTDYYNLRAAERLGLAGRFEAHRHALPEDERQRLEQQPAVLRARELRAVGWLPEARKEWQTWIKGLLPAQMAGAAVIAHRWGWYDRALLTAAKTVDFADVEVRFPLPFREEIETRAAASGIPSPILFSVVRSESAFQSDAGSPVGAMGLMQLMPGTGRETAAKLKLSLPSIQALFEPKTNLVLGTAYLQRMLKNYDGNLAMAAAAYNAGPGRVAKWRPSSGCRATESWVEAIPFTETHSYVRRVLANAVVYAWRLGEPTPSLHTLAPAVPAREASPQDCTFAWSGEPPSPTTLTPQPLSLQNSERP